ncbi:MAG: DUF3006 domain-containing protein [Clostridiaceae bacterium]|nr:DUF3006 domain-containing protein [Eubacteriales bacterium]
MLTVDRFEGERVVCIDDEGEPVVLGISELLSPAREGDSLREVAGGYAVDAAATDARRRRMRERLNRLFKD